MTEKFLDKVYDTRTADETRTLYDAWSGSYESEVSEHGYATPSRCADALAKHSSDLDQPILDFGCGTGLSGRALSDAGFTSIDGVDLSPEMLAQAGDKGVYRRLVAISAGENPIKAKSDYAAVAAIGVIGAGAAPVSTLHMLMNGLGSGGKLVLSFNDHALEDPVHEAAISEWTDCGAARLLFKEYGDHLPGIGLKSNVYVLEKV